MITIYRQTENGRIGVFTTPINEGCKASGKLGESQTMNLKFSVEKPIGFKIGDYVDLSTLEAVEYDGEYYDYRIPSFVKMKYVIKDNQYPTYNQTTGGYDYDLKLVSFYEAWGNMVYKFAIGVSGKETKWSYTGTIREHLAIFLENIKSNKDSHLFGDFLKEQAARVLSKEFKDVTEEDYDYLNEYNVFYVEDGKEDLSGVIPKKNSLAQPAPSYIDDRHVFLSFDGTKMSEVFKTLCSEENFDCDFWYDPVKNILCFGRCESGEIVELDSTSEEPECAITTSGASGEYANRLICYGAEKNLTARYRRDLVFHVTTEKMPLIFANDVYTLSEFNPRDYCLKIVDDNKLLDMTLFKRRNKILPIERNFVFGNSTKQIKYRRESNKVDYVLLDKVARIELQRNSFTIDTNDSRGIVVKLNLNNFFPDIKYIDRNSGVINVNWPYPVNSYYITIEVAVYDKDNNKLKKQTRRTLYFIGEFKADKKEKETDEEKGIYIISNNPKEGNVEVENGNRKEEVDNDMFYGDSNLYPQFNPTNYFDQDGNPTEVTYNRLKYNGSQLFSYADIGTRNKWIVGVELGVLTSNLEKVTINKKEVNVVRDFDCEFEQDFSIGVSLPDNSLSAECDLVLDGETFEDALVFNASNESMHTGESQYLWLKKEYKDLVGRLKKGKEFRLGDILFGKVPVSYFGESTDASIYAASVLNRNLKLPETYYLSYSHSERNGIVEYDDIRFTTKEEEGKKEGWKECHGTYIDVYDGIGDAELVEKVNIREDIYPRIGNESRGERIKQVGLYNTVIDEDNPNEEIKRHYQYAFNTDFRFTDEAIISGQDLRVRFTSGSMNGMEFDVQYYPTLKSGLTMEDKTVFESVNGADCFVISNNQDYGVELPNNIIFPKAGDEFILIGFDPTALDDDDGMVEKAEERLLADAVKRANQIRNNTATYTATLYADEKTDIDRFYIGRMVKVTDTATNTKRVSRVLGYDVFLDIPYDHPSFTIGQSAEYSRLRSIENYADSKSDGKLS